MNKLLLSFLLIIAAKNFCYGDEPPSWEPYKKISKNKEFFCWVDFNDNDTLNDAWNRKWILKVYDKDSILIWQKEYRHFGYSNGYLSDNGKKFIFIEYWYYHNDIAVKITSQDKQDVCINTSDFNIPEKFLIETVSHKLWLNDCELDDNNLIILTVDGKTWIIDIETGIMDLSKRGFYELSKDANTFAISFLIFVAVIIVFIIIMFFWQVKRKFLKKRFPPSRE